MSKIKIGKLIDRREEPRKETYLCIIPDTTVLTRETFKGYLRKYPKARKFGFSKKHTQEIAQLRKEQGVDHHPDKIYSLPVLWDQTQTFIA